ncbi:hypothetical protein N2152v2_003635 [Parachlorella kessleri]
MTPQTDDGMNEPLLQELGSSRDGELSRRSSNLSLPGLWSKRERVGADRGTGRYQLERERLGLPCLVQGGRHAGRSRVMYHGHHLDWFLFSQEFFITVVQQQTWKVILLAVATYMAMFWFWGCLYYLVVRYHPGCLYGATSFVEAWVFAVITHTTVGYGNTGPQQCWTASWMISIQIIMACLHDAVFVGVVFARISHPKQRGRSIYVSEVATMSRRDGILKFMFRIADVRKTQVVQPSIRAYLYTWGEGRVTAEGEKIPVRCEELNLGYIDGMLLLPLIIEHTIDERSPLCGHTHDSLMALNAEVVVIFEGTTEFGNPFMVRRSYLPTEIVWGHQFKQVIQKPWGGDTRYAVNLTSFHEVERQPELPALPPSELSRLVVNRAKRTVPYPLLGENTLVLSDVLCLAPNKAGQLCLTCRVADTYPNQMVDLTVRMYLYRWRPPGELQSLGPDESPYWQHQLECGFRSGADRLYLRLPVEVTHVIDESSPLAPWRYEAGLQEDALAEIVVLVTGLLLIESQNRMRQRTYVVGHHVRPGFQFTPIVKHPATTRDHKPRVRWARFHDITPVADASALPAPPGTPPPSGAGPGGFGEAAAAEAFLQSRGLSVAPESHAGQRSQEDRGRLRGAKPLRLPSIQEGEGSTPGSRLPQRDLSPSMWPGPPLTTSMEERSDFTVTAADLHRYAATMGPSGDATLMHGMARPRRPPLPTASFFQPSPRGPPPLPSFGRNHQQQQQQSPPQIRPEAAFRPGAAATGHASVTQAQSPAAAPAAGSRGLGGISAATPTAAGGGGSEVGSGGSEVSSGGAGGGGAPPHEAVNHVWQEGGFVEAGAGQPPNGGGGDGREGGGRVGGWLETMPSTIEDPPDESLDRYAASVGDLTNFESAWSAEPGEPSLASFAASRQASLQQQAEPPSPPLEQQQQPLPPPQWSESRQRERAGEEQYRLQPGGGWDQQGAGAKSDGDAAAGLAGGTGAADGSSSGGDAGSGGRGISRNGGSPSSPPPPQQREQQQGWGQHWQQQAVGGRSPPPAGPALGRHSAPAAGRPPRHGGGPQTAAAGEGAAERLLSFQGPLQQQQQQQRPGEGEGGHEGNDRPHSQPIPFRPSDWGRARSLGNLFRLGGTESNEDVLALKESVKEDAGIFDSESEPGGSAHGGALMGPGGRGVGGYQEESSAPSNGSQRVLD